MLWHVYETSLALTWLLPTPITFPYCFLSHQLIRTQNFGLNLISKQSISRKTNPVQEYTLSILRSNETQFGSSVPYLTRGWPTYGYNIWATKGHRLFWLRRSGGEPTTPLLSAGIISLTLSRSSRSRLQSSSLTGASCNSEPQQVRFTFCEEKSLMP